MFIVDDVQIENAKADRWIFLSAKVSEDGKTILFSAQLTKWDPVREDNIHLRTTVFNDSEFSRWWEKLRAKGWKFTVAGDLLPGMESP